MFLNLATILYFSFCAINRTKTDVHNEQLISTNNFDLDNTRNTGLDERVNKMTDIIDTHELNNELLAKIDENFYKKRVLETLQNNELSIMKKMEVLNRYLLYIHTEAPVNLFAGGLLDDWDFEIK